MSKVHNERVYLQLSLSVALPEAGVSHFQLGSEAQTILLPFFLRYLYSMTVLAGSTTVALYPALVRKPDDFQFEHSPVQVG